MDKDQEKKKSSSNSSSSGQSEDNQQDQKDPEIIDFRNEEQDDQGDKDQKEKRIQSQKSQSVDDSQSKSEESEQDIKQPQKIEIPNYQQSPKKLSQFNQKQNHQSFDPDQNIDLKSGMTTPNNEIQQNQNQDDQDQDDDDDHSVAASQLDIKQSSDQLDDFQENFNRADHIESILPFGVINPYGKFKKFWNVVIITLLTYVVLVVPVRLAFENTTNICVDSLFLADVLINLMSAYEDEKGLVVTERKKILINYLAGWFWIDLISSIPFYLFSTYFQGGNYNAILRFFRLPRIYKLTKVFKVLNLMKIQAIENLIFFLKLNREYTMIFKFILITLLVVHITGCLWFFIGSLDSYSWITVNNLDNTDNFTQYIASIYFVLTVLVTVGYGNIVPVNNYEYVFVFFFMFFGVAFFAYVMGSLTYSFSKLSEQMTLVKEREIFFNELAHSYQLPYETHEKLLNSVQHSIYSNPNKLLEIYNEEYIFQDLPPIIQGEFCLFLFKEIIQSVDFFQDKPREFLRKIFTYLKPQYLNEGDAIFFKGEIAKHVFFILKGRIATKCWIKQVKKNQTGEDHEINQLRTLIHVQGSYFGEVDLLVGRSRPEDAIAETQAEIWKIDKEYFLQLLNEFEDVKMEVVETASKKELLRKSTGKIQKNQFFIQLMENQKDDDFSMTKCQLLEKTKTKMIQNLNENKIMEVVHPDQVVIKNIQELDDLVLKLKEFERIKEKIQSHQGDFYDEEVEESVLKALKVSTHLQEMINLMQE